MTKPDAWMPLYIGDYKKNTGRLTRDQHGAYLLLIMEYWSTGPLRDDDAELAAIVLATAREWKALRPKIAPFFIVADGLWRHKRIDAEIDRWTEKKRTYIQRASAGGRAKAAKSGASSSASSTTKAVLAGCTSPSSQEVEGLPPSTLLGRFQNQDFRDAVVAECGEDFARTWLDQCVWVDVPAKAIAAPRGFTADKLRSELRALLAEHGVIVMVEAAAGAAA